MRSSTQHPRSSKFRRRLTAFVLIALGFTGSFILFQKAGNEEMNRVRDDVKRRAETRHTLIRQNIDDYVESLNSLRMLFGIQRFISLEKFQILSRNIMARHPGYTAISWVPKVARDERAYYEKHGQRVIAPDFHFTDLDPQKNSVVAADRSEYYPLYYAEPSSALATSSGRDISRGELQPYLDQARQSGRLIITGKVTIETPSGPEQGMVMICPVFALVSDESHPAQRGDFLGYILGSFKMSDLLGQTWQNFRGPVTEVMFLDATAASAEKRFLYYYSPDSDPTPTEAEFRSGWYRELPLLIGDSIWLVLHRPKAGWFEQQATLVPYILLISGVAVTLLLAAYLRSVMRRADLIEKEVNQRTTELRNIQSQLENDINQREKTEELLRASEQQLQGLMENSPNAIFVKDLEGRYLTVNRRFAELHGLPREHFIGRNDLDVFAPDVAARIRSSDARVIANAQPLELEESYLLPDDGQHTSIMHKFPLIDAHGSVQGLCGIATDITERKRAEAEARENRRQIESILGQLPGMAFRFIHDGKFTPVYISRGALGLTGHSARDFLEQQVTLDDIIHAEDRERVRAAIAAAVRKRRAFEVEYRIISRSGVSKWVLERGQGVYDEEGVLLFIEGLSIDITQRKDAESEKLIVERRLLEGQKLESIGVLAGGIAHDFNNLLTGIMGNASLASLELPPGSPIKQNLKQIETASQRAADLCQQMLAYAGKGRFVVQRIDLGALVENTVPLLRASISKRAHLRFMLRSGLPSVMADSTQMRQIVMNLVLNASEALSDRDGDITITTDVLRLTPDLMEGAVLSPPDYTPEFIKLEVSDTGCGMSPETITKIFEPFFTTKFAGRGLGLAAVLGIIRSHRGGLKLRSTVGKGSTFTLFFPVAGATPEPSAPRRGTGVPWKREGRALIIDDEEHVLQVTAGMLASCGLVVETARDGYEGLDLFRAKPDQFDIVVLDMTMPRLSGEETLVLLREVQPDVRVIFMSGYNRREVVDSLAGSGMLSFIQKPFTLSMLREHLHTMLLG